jgi:hypothetical protein
MSFFVSLFEDKLVGVDNREPWISGLDIPGVEGSFTIFAPEALPWIQMAGVRDFDQLVDTRGPRFSPCLSFSSLPCNSLFSASLQ